jgi:hypothetical protein
VKKLAVFAVTIAATTAEYKNIRGINRSSTPIILNTEEGSVAGDKRRRKKAIPFRAWNIEANRASKSRTRNVDFHKETVFDHKAGFVSRILMRLPHSISAIKSRRRFLAAISDCRNEQECQQRDGGQQHLSST